MFVAAGAALLDELARYAPEVVETVERAMEAAQRDLDFVRDTGLDRPWPVRVLYPTVRPCDRAIATIGRAHV